MNNDSFGNYLKQKFHEWSGKEIGRGHPIPSQNEFAKWLKVPTTNLSVWMNDVRPPSTESADILAERLGIEVYDKLGLPRKMPRNKKLYFLASIWEQLSDQAQDELQERAKNLLDEKEKLGSDRE